jgi:hypothetical protein
MIDAKLIIIFNILAYSHHKFCLNYQPFWSSQDEAFIKPIKKKSKKSVDIFQIQVLINRGQNKSDQKPF